MATYRADINVVDNSRRRKRGMIAISLAAVLVILGTGAFLAARTYILDGLPSLPDKRTMWQLNLQKTITLVDQRGQTLGHRGPRIGRPLKLEQMPPHLPNAVLAIEDERFFEHEGVDNRAILRAFFNNARSGDRSQGGSTLTQQLVKTMLLTPEKKYKRKIQEAILARDMEAVLSKPEILELYINRVSMGPQIFGVEAASQRYFRKSARDVTLSESALLAALLQAPSRFNPTSNFDGAWARAGLVLNRMVANGFITEAERQDALRNPPEIVETNEPGLPESILGYAFDHIDEVASRIAGLKEQDLVVTVTLDADHMRAAHESLNAVLDKSGKSKKVSQGALVSINNQTGAITAMVGGRDYTQTKFNRAVQAQRQPGSSFKTFVYAAAFQDGFTPATVRIDQPTEIAGWKPENYTLRYRGPMTIREALKLSINTIAAQIGAEVGPTRVASTARAFGIKSEMRPEYSLALGSSEVNLLELSTAYTVFANEGVLRPSHIITKISNTSGDVLYSRRENAGARVYPVPYSRQLTSILRDTVETGTAYGAKLGKRQAAGKTGTSQNYRDAWFIGFTAQATTGVWMGNDDNSPMRKVTGGLLPVDVWADYMKAIHKGVPNRPLPAPNPLGDDVDGAEISQFYAGLEQALTVERDLAAGAGRGRGGAGR